MDEDTYLFYGYNTVTAQDGPFRLVAIQHSIAYLQYRDEIYLRVVDVDYFKKNFKKEIKDDTAA